MGYIVNATGRRVGWCYLWCDVFYSEKIYYSEYIHSLYRIRYFLVYFFSHRIFEKLAYFYSHFSFVQFYRRLRVSVYWYDGLLEQDFSDYLFYWTRDLYRVNANVDRDRRVPLFIFNCYKLFPWLLIFLKGHKSNWLVRRRKNNVEYQYFKKYMYYKYKRYSYSNDLKNKGLKTGPKKYATTLYKVSKFKLSVFDKKGNSSIVKENLYRYFDFNAKKVHSYPLFLNKRYLYTLFKLPYLKQLLLAINKGNFHYFLKYIKSFFVKDHLSINRLFFNLKLSLVFLVFIFVMTRSIKSFKRFTFMQRESKKGKKNIKTFSILRRFFFIWGFSPAQRGVGLSGLRSYLKVIFEFMTFWNIDINYFIISNGEVTAKFLSRYMAIKLQNNYSIRELLSPIKRELKRIKNKNVKGHGWGQRLLRWSIYLRKKRLYRKQLYKKVLSLSYFNYKLLQLSFYESYKLILSLDMILVYIFLRNRLNYVKSKEKVIGVTLNYIISRSKLNQFISFNTNNLQYYFESLVYNNQSFIQMLIPLNTNVNTLKEQKFYLSFYNLIYNCYIEFLLNNSIFYLNDTYFLFKCKGIRSACWHMGRYLKFSYWKENFGIYKEALGLNHLRARKYSYDIPNRLLGYKIHFRGRFTRRQRSKSYWLHCGRVPITRVMANIDFGYYVIPLVNSAVSIKIWLHRSSNLSDLHTYYL